MNTVSARAELIRRSEDITRMVCDITARAPSTGELRRLAELELAVGERYDVQCRRWERLDATDRADRAETVRWAIERDRTSTKRRR